MFQLFNAEDLNALSEPDLDELVKAIRDANSTSPDTFLRIAAASNMTSHWEDARRSLQQSPPMIDRNEITNALRARASQVFEQLLGSSPGQPGGLLDPLQRDILPQLLDQNALDALNAQSKAKKIFEIAISCELSYFNSYSFLRSTKELAYQQFGNLTALRHTQPQVPKGPDSRYSPYSRRHPLYQ
jgi:hypothetical protein